jgi:hypothetical protein
VLVTGGSNPGSEAQRERVIGIIFDPVKLQIEGAGAGKMQVNEGMTART